jgi:hypothetical protein
LLKGYAQTIHDGKTPKTDNVSLPKATLKAFSTFRDVNRAPHVYDAQQGVQNSGAFLTWFWDENDPKMPRDYFATPDLGTRIPFNTNDVDCVVNTNVVKALTLSAQESSPGYREACDYLNGVVANQKFYDCGMYYPSTYVLPYSIASAQELGASCLEPSRAAMLSLVQAGQQADGSWRNSWENPYPDTVQSTAWALNVLLLLGDPTDSKEISAVRSGIDFLLSQSKHDDNGNLYWGGEIFFAATFLARTSVVWRSTPYTTAVVLRALVLANRKWGL